MNLSAVFSAQAILAALFGLCFLLAPGWIMQVYGYAPDPASVFFARLLGSAYIGIAMISWGARHTTLVPRPFLVPAFATANTLGAVVAIHQAIIGLGKCDLIRELTDKLFLHVRAIRQRTIFEQDRARRSVVDHREIVAALEARDTERAERLVREHTLRLRDHVERYVDLD